MRPHWIILHLGRTTINTHNNQPDVGLEWQSWFVCLDVDEEMNVCCLVSLLLFVWKPSVCWSSNQVTDITIYHERKRNNTHNQRNNHHDEHKGHLLHCLSLHTSKSLGWWCRWQVLAFACFFWMHYLVKISPTITTHHPLNDPPIEWARKVGFEPHECSILFSQEASSWSIAYCLICKRYIGQFANTTN